MIIYLPLLLCLAATFYLVGLIWVIQLLQYPLFAHVGTGTFLAYHAEHSRRIVLALSVPTLTVFGCDAALFWLRPAAVPLWAVALNFGLTLLFWVVTACVQVPLHGKLGGGFEATLARALVRSNWARTCIWTAQGFLLLWMAAIAV